MHATQTSASVLKTPDCFVSPPPGRESHPSPSYPFLSCHPLPNATYLRCVLMFISSSTHEQARCGSVPAVSAHPFLFVWALAANICAAKPIRQQGEIVSSQWVVVISSVCLIKWPLVGLDGARWPFFTIVYESICCCSRKKILINKCPNESLTIG